MTLRLSVSLVMPMALIAGAAHAQEPWIDAGQQARIQHYNDLIEQQSAPGQKDAAEEARNARGVEDAAKSGRTSAVTGLPFVRNCGPNTSAASPRRAPRQPKHGCA